MVMQGEDSQGYLAMDALETARVIIIHHNQGTSLIIKKVGVMNMALALLTFAVSYPLPSAEGWRITNTPHP